MFRLPLNRRTYQHHPPICRRCSNMRNKTWALIKRASLSWGATIATPPQSTWVWYTCKMATNQKYLHRFSLALNNTQHHHLNIVMLVWNRPHNICNLQITTWPLHQTLLANGQVHLPIHLCQPIPTGQMLAPFKRLVIIHNTGIVSAKRMLSIYKKNVYI